MRRMHIMVQGRVQKVLFRHTAQKMAQSLGLSGWIRNVGSDKNESEVQGEELFLQQYVLFALRGSHLADVQKITIKYIPLVSGEKTFSVKESIP